jgi:hypothetical protein
VSPEAAPGLPHGGRIVRDREEVEALVRLPYMPPAVAVPGTVQDLTRAGVTHQSNAVGFEEIGGS